MSAQEFNLEVTPILPKALSRLEELANNLWYSWNIPTRRLFERIDDDLWNLVGHNPKLFLRNVAQERLLKVASDPLFLNVYNHVLSMFDSYCHTKEPRNSGAKLTEDDLIVYFCAEYGFHESLPVYSGGLGILAGDHCKTASDLRLPFVGIGLFYHQGFFTQQIDAEGNQKALYNINDPQHLPITAVVDDAGNDITVGVNIGDQHILVKAWKMQVGHITLYLLDTNVPQNNHDDCQITHQLYGGNEHTRIKQEIVLGIAGVRMLRRLGVAPTVWHINEGHAAFSILERLREFIAGEKSFEAALEAIAASSVFTTHTPVPAGHDQFHQDLIMHYLGYFCHELRLSREAILALGCWPHNSPDFNMTTLAIQGSRHINGVSRIHGDVSSEICTKFWPEITSSENPIRYITNGVHVSSMLAREWSELFDENLGVNWSEQLCDNELWQRIDNIPDQQFWDVKQRVKSRMLKVVRNALTLQYLRNQVSETHLERLLKLVDPNNPNILTIGFARRFATYKRATLLLKDIDRLRTILNDINRPVVFIFAGKAHPADVPGQDLLRELHRISGEPDFIGKILVVQGYDLGLSRRLVSGVDVWLNNPVYPQEASGTSGMKVAINGGINLSVLDGWWPESYDGTNGWGIKPSPHDHNIGLRDYEDARSLYEVLQDEVIPLYYEQGKYGYSEGWIKKSKRSMLTILPRFNTVRMLNDYLNKLYLPASRQGKRLNADNYVKAQELANWKAHIRAKWEGVHVRQLATPQTQLLYGESITIQVAVRLNELQPNDITVELLLSRKIYHPEFLRINQEKLQTLWNDEGTETVSYKLVPEHPLHDSGEYLYTLSLKPDLCGGLSYRIRVFPYHQLLSDSYEMGMMRWV
ncbi:alpha-glucan family phosphorylase [Candidatus Parabeggiatoa sp. HSG14]|uniref:alpha-glucan family phosphorylase n=1 Tax=Candidatus Parabeggiatoa sp. HSG14 TaxID=3055593 RepID=UPI0025A7870F|nr:alpha-glucan family phosphorylase [Thiotrichales bacterium HSG14]